MNLKAMNLKAEKGHRGTSDRPENLSCQRSLGAAFCFVATSLGSVIMAVRQRGRIERGLDPASARSFHGEFPDVVLVPTSRRVDLAEYGHSLLDRPETFDRIVVGPPRALLGIASRKRRRTM